MCGGTVPVLRLRIVGAGLSPRVRGNLGHGLVVADGLGSIPACAGEPSARPARRGSTGVYPRVCGGTNRARVSACATSGLSPRVRGNPPGRAGERRLLGSIPACAGEPRSARRRPGGSWVYPRVCGGTSTSAAKGLAEPGLSPRVRGNRKKVLTWCNAPGSIPACAGEPRWPAGAGTSTAVYPRVCGGTAGWPAAAASSQGLSPRVRGNRDRLRDDGLRTGSIPACAGEPHGNCLHYRRERVYPRVCGGTRSPHIDSIHGAGLSPRVRGNHDGQPDGRFRPGSIPACAGEPSSTARPWPKSAVYPRVCGGTAPRKAVPVEAGGLSPRVRGNPATVSGQQVLRGSIPACAGEPRWEPWPASGPRVYPRVCGGTECIDCSNPVDSGLSPRVRGNLVSVAAPLRR